MTGVPHHKKWLVEMNLHTLQQRQTRDMLATAVDLFALIEKLSAVSRAFSLIFFLFINFWKHA